MTRKRNPQYKIVHSKYFRYDGTLRDEDLSYNSSEEYRSPGVSNPGWRRAIAHATGASTALNGYTESFETDPWSYTSYYKLSPTSDPVYNSGNGDTVISGYRIFQVSEESYVRARASAAAQAAAHSALRTFDSGTFIGELSETVRMLRSPLKSITDLTARYARAARNRSNGIKSRKGRNKAIYDSYLQYVYGVKPLINDVDSALLAAAELSVGGIQTKRFNGSYSDTIVMADGLISTPANKYYQPDNLRLAFKTTAKHSCRIIGAVKMTNPNSNVLGGDVRAGERLGASLDNFVPTVYNLLPFSFVLDYFSNVGTVIDAASNFNCDFAWSQTTYVIELETNAHIIVRGDPTLLTGGYYSGGSYRYKGRSFSRTGGIPPISIESFYFKLPSLNQILNLGALIGSLNASRNI